MKRMLYYLPVIIAVLFYGSMLLIFQSFHGFHPAILSCVLLLFIGAILLHKEKWWGCLFGIGVGMVLINMGTKETGQIINELPIGVCFVLYFVLCGLICFTTRKR